MTLQLEVGGLARIFDGPSVEQMASVLSLRSVGVRFGGVAALSNISVDISPYDVMAVVGPNGAGKTTLLNAVCGLIRAQTTGEIDLMGQPMHGRPPVAVARAGVGRSFQDPPLMEHESVLENVLGGAHLRLGYGMAAQIFRRPRVKRAEAESRERAMATLEFAGLQSLASTRVGGLPYGTRKLVDIARAMVGGPTVLLLDEPTSGLDAREQQVVERMLVDVARSRSVTVLVVEHHMDLVRRVANRVIGLQAGQVLAVGSPTEVLDSETFRAAVVGASNDGKSESKKLDSEGQGN